MWFQETEGAKFWMQVLAELKQRGVRDILICCVDGLKGFPEAIEAIFPKTVVQTCIVHLPGTRDLRRDVGQALPGDHAGVVERLGVRDAVFGVSAAGTSSDLHDG
jgi:Transposase, Mutator family